MLLVGVGLVRVLLVQGLRPKQGTALRRCGAPCMPDRRTSCSSKQTGASIGTCSSSAGACAVGEGMRIPVQVLRQNRGLPAAAGLRCRAPLSGMAALRCAEQDC